MAGFIYALLRAKPVPTRTGESYRAHHFRKSFRLSLLFWVLCCGLWALQGSVNAAGSVMGGEGIFVAAWYGLLLGTPTALLVWMIWKLSAYAFGPRRR